MRPFAWGTRGRGFESRHSDHLSSKAGAAGVFISVVAFKEISLLGSFFCNSMRNPGLKA